MPDAPTARDVVRGYLDAVGSLDLEALARSFHDDVVMDLPYAPPGFPQQVSGKPAVCEFFAGMPGFVAPLSFYDYQLVLVPETEEVIAEYRSASEVLATGNPYRNRYISRFTVRDGVIERFAEYFDPLILIEALGGRVELP